MHGVPIQHSEMLASLSITEWWLVNAGPGNTLLDLWGDFFTAEVKRSGVSIKAPPSTAFQRMYFWERYWRPV